MAEFNAEQLRKYIEKIVTQELDKTQKFENFLTGQILNINSGVYDIQLSGENETPIKAVSINDKRYSIEDDVYVIKATTGLSTSYLILDRIIDLQEEFANLTLAERFIANDDEDGVLKFEDLQSPRYIPRRDPEASEQDKEADRDFLSIIAANGAFKVSAIFSSAANGDGTVKEIKGGLSITLSHYDEETEEEQILKTYYLIADDMRGQPEAMYDLDQEKIFLIDDENIKSYFNQITFEKVGDDKTFTCSKINLVSGSLIDVDAVIQVKTEIENGKNYFSKEVPSGYEDKIKLSAAVYYDGQQLVQDNQVQYYWLVKNTNIDLNKIQVFRREWVDTDPTTDIEHSLDHVKEYTTNYSYYYDKNLKQYILNAGENDEYQYVEDVELEGNIVEKWKREEANIGSKYLYTSFIHRYLPEKEKELSLIGEGWSCLNSYEDVPLIALEYTTVPDETIRLWDSNNNTITLTSTEYQKYFPNYENTVKCLIRCGDNIVSSDEFIIYNHANESFSAKIICEEPAEILFEKTNFALTCDVINSNKKIKEADYTFEYKWFRWAKKEGSEFEWTEIVDVPITAETIYLYDRESSEVTDKNEAKLYVKMQPNDEGKESIKCRVTIKKNDTGAFVSVEEAEKTVLSRVSLDVEIIAREYYKYYLSKNSFVQFEQAVNENETEWNGDWDIYDPAGSTPAKEWKPNASQINQDLTYADIFEKFEIFSGENDPHEMYVYFTKRVDWIQKPKDGTTDQEIVIKEEVWDFPLIARQVGYVNGILTNLKTGYSIDQLNTFNQLTQGGREQGIYYDVEIGETVNLKDDPRPSPDANKKYYQRKSEGDGFKYTLVQLSAKWGFHKDKEYFVLNEDGGYSKLTINNQALVDLSKDYYKQTTEINDKGDSVVSYVKLDVNTVNFELTEVDWPEGITDDVLYVDVKEKLFINADYIQTGTLRVGNIGSEKFYASINDRAVKIGGFEVTETGISNTTVLKDANKQPIKETNADGEIVDKRRNIYLGEQGLWIGDGLSAYYNSDGKLLVNISGEVSIRGGVGGDGSTLGDILNGYKSEIENKQLCVLYHPADENGEIPTKPNQNTPYKNYPKTNSVLEYQHKWHKEKSDQDIWQSQKVDYDDGNAAWSSVFQIKGLDGQEGPPGPQGKSISYIAEYYGVSNSEDTQPTSWTWVNNSNTTATIPDVDASNPYLWNYEKSYYSIDDSNNPNNAISTTNPVIVYRYTKDGDDGASFGGIEEYYIYTASNSAPNKPSITGGELTLNGWNKTDSNYNYPTRLFKWNCEAIKQIDKDGNSSYINVTEPEFLGEMPKQTFYTYRYSKTEPDKPANGAPTGEWKTSIPNNGNGGLWVCEKTAYDIQQDDIAWSNPYLYGLDPSESDDVQETVDVQFMYAESTKPDQAPDWDEQTWKTEAEFFSHWIGRTVDGNGKPTSTQTYPWVRLVICYEDGSKLAQQEPKRMSDMEAITLAAQYQIKNNRYVQGFYYIDEVNQKYTFPKPVQPYEFIPDAVVSINWLQGSVSNQMWDNHALEYLSARSISPDSLLPCLHFDFWMPDYENEVYEYSYSYEGDGYVWDFWTCNNPASWRGVSEPLLLCTNQLVTSNPVPKSAITAASIAGKDFQVEVPEGDIGRWCRLYDKTVMSGGAIVTGSVTADKIKTNSLSAIAADLGEISTGLIKSKNYQEEVVTSSQKINNIQEATQVESGFNSLVDPNGDIDVYSYKNRYVVEMGGDYAGSYVVNDYFVDEIQFKFTPNLEDDYGRMIDLNSISLVDISYISYSNAKVSFDAIKRTGKMVGNNGPLGSGGPAKIEAKQQGDDIIINIKYYSDFLQALFLSQKEAEDYYWEKNYYMNILPSQVDVKILYSYYPQSLKVVSGGIISFPKNSNPFLAFPKFQVQPDGGINSTSGKIGGFHITENHLADGEINENGSTDNHLVMFSPGLTKKSGGVERTYVFWAGQQTTTSNDSSRPFWITKSGYLFASQGNIGGWEINESSFLNSTQTIGLSSSGDAAFWAGNATAAQAPFLVTQGGNLKATSAVFDNNISIVAQRGNTAGTVDSVEISSTAIRIYQEPSANADIIWMTEITPQGIISGTKKKTDIGNTTSDWLTTVGETQDVSVVIKSSTFNDDKKITLQFSNGLFIGTK